MKEAPPSVECVLALAKKMFNFAVDREWIEANPASRLKPVAPERARTVYCPPTKLRALWAQLDGEHYRIRTLFQVLLLTAQRSGDVSRIRWVQIAPRLDQRQNDGIRVQRLQTSAVWTIPAEEIKNRRGS